MKFKQLSLLVVLLIVSLNSAQSIDEEPAIPVGEGSGDDMIDDEDMVSHNIQGSSLPPDTDYRTTPTISPRFSTATVPKTPAMVVVEDDYRITSTVVRQKVASTQPETSTFRISTRPYEVPETTTGFFSSNLPLVILGIILLVLLILVISILICKSCSNRKREYEPGVRGSPEALLSK